MRTVASDPPLAGLLVVGQRIHRRPADPAQRGIQAGHQRGQRAIPGGDHHPEPRPGQPRAKQQRDPQHPVRPRHPRPRPPVPLQPQPRLADPWPVGAPTPGPPTRLGLGHRPARGPLIAVEPHHHQPLVGLVCPDAALRAVHPLLDLVQERIDQPRPAAGPFHRPAPIPRLHIAAHRLRIDLGQLRRRMRAAGRVVRLENLHDLPVRLLHGPSGPVGIMITNR